MTVVGDRTELDAALRRRARVLSARALRYVPQDVVDSVHARWVNADDAERALLRPLAAVLARRPLGTATVTVPGGQGERIASAGTRLERRLWWYGRYGSDRVDVELWRRLCADARNVLEVGVDFGYHAVVGAAATPGLYTAIEANPVAASLARRNLELNRLRHVELLEAALVGDGGPDEIEIALPGSEAVRVRTLQAAALIAGRDLVKVDVGSADATVLTAALTAIRRSRPRLLLRLPGGANRLQVVLRDLVADGYLIRVVDDPLRPASLSDIVAIGQVDVLLSPSERPLPMPEPTA